MASELSPEMRMKALLGSVIVSAKSAAEAIDEKNADSFGRWINTLATSTSAVAKEFKEWVERQRPPDSLEDRLKRGSEN